MNNATQTNTPKLFVKKSAKKLNSAEMLDIKDVSFLLCERSNGKRIVIYSAGQLDPEEYKEGVEVELKEGAKGKVKIIAHINSCLGALIKGTLYCCI